jgi:hypothetical protein
MSGRIENDTSDTDGGVAGGSSHESLSSGELSDSDNDEHKSNGFTLRKSRPRDGFEDDTLGQSQNFSYSVEVAMLEIYNEMVT